MKLDAFSVALLFLNFPSLRTDSFLDNIAPRHISVLKSLFLKAAVVSPVVCFTLATSIRAMDVLLSAGQCPVCLSHSLGTQGKLRRCGSSPGLHILGLSFTCTHYLGTQCASSAAMNNTFFL